MQERSERRLRLAMPADIAAMVALDRSATRSAAREQQFRQAVEVGHGWVVTEGAEVAAFCLLDYHFFGNGFIELLLVGERYRRRGIGRMMLTALPGICKTERLFTSTNSSNLPMQRLLQACDYRRCGWIDGLDPGDQELVYRYQPPAGQLKPTRQPASSGSSVNIVPLSWELLPDVNRSNQPFTVFGRAVPSLADGRWTWTEEIFPLSYEKQFPDEQMDYSQYVDSPDRTMLLAYLGDACVGQIRMRRNWNKYCYVEDLEVSREHRKQGVGSQLIAAAIAWAKAGGMPGLMLEAQDINLNACRFYQRIGFELGGVDTLIYGNYANRDERAMFWYMRF